MHVPTARSPVEFTKTSLDFVWLELTNRCNLECIHCYAESGPTTGEKDRLSEDDYLGLINQLHDLGCRRIQFIGGEPTLNKSLSTLIEAAYLKDFDFIEVFTNLTRLPVTLLNVFSRFNAAVATSFYSSNPAVHDEITRHAGSFERTVGNMRRVLDAGLSLRVGVIEMEQNRADMVATWDFLTQMGIKQIGTDRARKIGRANLEGPCSMTELCGSCAGNILSIGPDGIVAPCNMSRKWSVGSVLERRLEDIVCSPELARVRREISDNAPIATQRQAVSNCAPTTCDPYPSCCPSTQRCYPCAPNGCVPCRPNS
jgi:MoaA/NifB/PqqE/SkfB family radical SAM enzyme